jgi:hypothetical protein
MPSSLRQGLRRAVKVRRFRTRLNTLETPSAVSDASVVVMRKER